MQAEDFIVIDDSPEPEDRRPRQGTQPPAPEAPEQGIDIPIPFVSTVLNIDHDIGEPGLYIHLERPEFAQKRSVTGGIVHHKDILLNHLPHPRLRAN